MPPRLIDVYDDVEYARVYETARFSTSVRRGAIGRAYPAHGMSARRLSIDNRMTFASFGGPLAAALALGEADAEAGADALLAATVAPVAVATAEGPGASVGEFFEQAVAAKASVRLATRTAVGFIPVPSQAAALFGKLYCRAH
jgi:hypothetical protein